MARVTRQGTVSPNLGLLRDALGEQQQAQANLTRAFQRQEEAKARALQETADTLAQEADRLAEQREAAMQDAIARSRKMQAQADELGAMAPSAGRLFGSDAQAASFGAALSIATGAMLSARTGGDNVALKIIDRAIQRDMESQREAIKNKQFSVQMGLSLAQEMRAAFRDDMVASDAIQATLLRYTENRLNAIIAQTNDQVLRARGEETIANLRMQYAEKVEAATRGSFGVSMALPLRKAQAMLAASQGETLPPISTQAMQEQAAQSGGEHTQQGLGAAAAQKADEAREDAQKAQAARRQADRKQATANKLKRRPEQPQAPNPLAQYGVKADPAVPGWGRTPDGAQIPLQAIPKAHARRGTRGLQRIQVPAALWAEPPPGWAQSAVGKNEWVREGGEKVTELTEKEQAELSRRQDRTLRFNEGLITVPPDLNNEERRKRVGRSGVELKVPWYPNMEKDLEALSTVEKDLRNWARLYKDVKDRFKEGAKLEIKDQRALAKRLAGIALFNRNISQGGVLNEGEVKTIGGFLGDPSSWKPWIDAGGWDAMNDMMKEAYKATADAVLNEGRQSPGTLDAVRGTQAALANLKNRSARGK